MHEFSICEGLVALILEEVGRRNGGRILRARVAVGGLRQVVPEYFQAAYDILTRNTEAEGSVLEIRTVPLGGRCRTCGWFGPLEEMNFRCGGCGAEDVQIDGGTELVLETVEVEDREEKDVRGPGPG